MPYRITLLRRLIDPSVTPINLLIFFGYVRMMYILSMHRDYIHKITQGVQPAEAHKLSFSTAEFAENLRIPTGYIYVKNSGVDGVWKIGKTNNIERRRHDYQCGLALPIVFEAVFNCFNATNAEKMVKTALEPCKYNNVQNNELYACERNQLLQIVLEATILSNTGQLFCKSAETAISAAVAEKPQENPVITIDEPITMAIAITTTTTAAAAAAPVPTRPPKSIAAEKAAAAAIARAETPDSSAIGSTLGFLRGLISSAPAVTVAAIAPTWCCVAKSPTMTYETWIMQPNSVYISTNIQRKPGTKRSKWHCKSDPRIIGIIASNQEYEKYIRDTPALFAALSELSGKELGCWCKKIEKCHGAVLIKLWHERFG